MTGKQFVEACKKDKCRTLGRGAGLDYHNKYTELLGEMKYKGIRKDGTFSKRYPYGVVGHCCIGVQYHLIKGGLEAFVPKNGYIWNTNNYRKWLMSEPNIKDYGKVEWVTDRKKAKVGAIAFKGDGKNKKSATHTCVFIKCEGDYVWTVDFNVWDSKRVYNNGTIHKRHKKYFLGFANMPYPIDLSKYQKAYHPMTTKRVSCKWNEGLHKKCSSSKANYRDYPTDLVGKDTGRDWASAPCDMIVLRKYTSASHCIWLRSLHKVIIPCCKEPVYLYMMSQHQDNSEMGAVGHVYKQGEKMFREGKNGNATGNHLHVVFAWSTKKHLVKKINGKRVAPTFGSGWIKNNLGAWVLRVPNGHNIKIDEAVFY